MNKKSEPAFPKAGNEWSEMAWVPAPAQDGMTLRDYFAAKALMGMMASRNPNSPRFQPDDDAAYVYAVADAMLKAREQ